MASITVRNLDDGLKRRLRIRAAENGRSMEQEAREILKAALEEEAGARTETLERHPRAVQALRRRGVGDTPKATHAGASAVRLSLWSMFVLDTNVVSELMRERVDPRVRAWLDRSTAPTPCSSTTITEAEILTTA